MCAANLKAIGSGCSIFGRYEGLPYVLYNYGDATEPPSTTADRDDLGDLTNTNAMQGVWILIMDYAVQEEHFRCPADKDWQARKDIEPGTDLKKYGWNSPRNYSYGVHKSYGKKRMSPYADTPPQGAFPIFADKNHQADGQAGSVYYRDDAQYRKPGNHPENGFNYLVFGTAVMRQRYTHGTVGRFSACGVNGDDIYVAQDANGTKPGTADPAAGPDLDTDSFILPWK